MSKKTQEKYGRKIPISKVMNNVALHVQNKKGQWYINSGCSKQMIGYKGNFLKFKEERGGNV